MSASDIHKRLQQSNLPPLPDKINIAGGSSSIKQRKIGSKDYSVLDWDQFFDEKEKVELDENRVFNVYRKGSNGLVLLLLHGGGYSGLTWACFAEAISNLVDCRIVAPDLRGHGDTTTDDDEDLSAETQSKDVGDIMNKLFGSEQPPTFLIGHSMGGALAVHVCHDHLLTNLIALMVIDVVEGSALDALHSMQNFLRSRPLSFKSVENAIEWCVRSGTVRNLKSARVSMPSQIRLSTEILSDQGTDLSESLEEEVIKTVHNSLKEQYTWRINLTKSEPYWQGWFKGLSAMFLGVPVPKVLLLAGVDRLDKDLTVGQMQGKFQMLVLPKVGHAVHEDSPERMADAVTTFCVRHKFANAKTDFKPVYPGC